MPDPSNTPRQAMFGEWKAIGDNLVAEATFTSPAGTWVKTDEQLDHCEVRVWGYYPDSNTGVTGLQYDMRQKLCCDSARYMYSSQGGCVYPWSIPHMKIKWTPQPTYAP